MGNESYMSGFIDISPLHKKIEKLATKAEFKADQDKKSKISNIWFKLFSR